MSLGQQSQGMYTYGQLTIVRFGTPLFLCLSVTIIVTEGTGVKLRAV